MSVVNVWVGLVLALVLAARVRGEILTPPYFNLAEGRRIYASATCGEESEGPEMYCKLVGTNAENDADFHLSYYGQQCDVCDATKQDKKHPPEYAVDGMETWWQSPPLSRGMKYNEVNLTIDFGQEFHVAYVFIRMGNSPRPGLWILEKSKDYGKTYAPWQYFSDTSADCELHFGKKSLQPIASDDDVICVTEYSKIVPLEGGEIPISILNNRPSANQYFNSSILQEWTRATNVRFRFLRTKNFLGHLMSVARQDPSVTRRYFYSIKDISIGGRCMCNGHAETCDNLDPTQPTLLLCRCQHNTCGAKCEMCCPGYEQKAWRISKSYEPFFCEPCNCFQHSSECTYDREIDRQRLSLDIYGNYEGGGVCQNCQHNTEGTNCNKCKATFFKPYDKHWNESDVCQPCNCDPTFSTGNCAEGLGQCECRKEFTPPDCRSCSFGYYDYPTCKPCECFLNGTVDLQCEATLGQCPCKPNFGGTFCKECASDYYNFPECVHCECNPQGSLSSACDQQSGNCTCKSNYGGKHCDDCQNGYYSYPNCSYCNCDVKGTKEGICDKETGICWCKEGYGGKLCDQCIPGYYGYPDCKPCNCSQIGSVSHVCESTGKCPCLSNFAGRTCNQCSPGYYKYPECLPCNCDSHGAIGVSCDNEGLCACHHNFDGQHCDQCKEGFYNFPSCEDCNCHPAGVIEGFAGCGSVPAGELCECKERVEGRICNKCKQLFWNLTANNPDGCEKCNCHIPGVLGGIAVCDSEMGQCLCKPSVAARGCTSCADGTYDLQEDDLFGCADCECDIGGSLSPFCDKVTGQCSCQSRVDGRTCKEPLKTHYFPTLYQFLYEIEDGRTPENTPVRYSYDEEVFRNYSWKGYAVFSQLQNEVLHDIYILKPSIYIMVLKYVNRNPDTVIGTVKITPDNPTDIEQKIQVQFKNSSVPASVIASGLSGSVPSPFVMNPGRWTFSLKVDKYLLVDYFVLLPEDFYLATILKQKVENPCEIDDVGLCRDYKYPNVSNYDTTWGAGGYIDLGAAITKPTEYFEDQDHLRRLDVKNTFPVVNSNQNVMDYQIMLSKPGRYVFLVNYITPKDDRRTHLLGVDVKTDVVKTGKVKLYSCTYTMVCRQVVTTENGTVGVYPVNENEVKIKLRGNDANVGVHSITAIPIEEWSLDFIQPKPICIQKDGKCAKTSFRSPPESKKIQFEQEMDGSEGQSLPPIIIQNTTSYIYLSSKDLIFDLKGKVASPGYYVFVVQYYQPDFAEFDLNIIIHNGQYYEAKLPVKHCPSKSGCRALIIQTDGNTQFSLTENFVITHELPDKKNVYLDYLLVVPSDVYSQKILEEEELDRASEFIVNCASNHFDVDTTQEGFCRDSVFSITAGYNNGALPCDCHYYGSLSFECDKFGGQCKCKPNVIGRKCEACKTGYYGFPDCRPCNCPSTALCETETGKCICPTNVVGARCDQCAPLTYGFDPIIGCEECNCNPLGVESSLNCDLLNGSCSCKTNVVNRKCDFCQAGHFAFPYCVPCECDPRGSTPEEICDQQSAECFCKPFVIGHACGLCKEGTFNLQESNEDGCTECFCFGKTTRCKSSSLLKTAVYQMTNWTLVAINVTEKLEVTPLNVSTEEIDDHNIQVDISGDALKNKTLYFSVPPIYLGRKITSYGGFLKYGIFYTIGTSGKATMGADVILQGANTYLTYNSLEQPPVATEYFSSLELVEMNFLLPLGMSANREHIMVVLENLQGIYIRAIYWSDSLTTKLTRVYLDDALEYVFEDFTPAESQLATTVEHCQCPPNYQGLSCEECAPGYYRISTGPHGGYCVPCQCNTHADTCDVNTGICINCQHNTKGEHCELCEVGYHGNALQGTPGDCLICACPLPVTSNNFATACDLSSDGEEISCECRDGYFGARCQSCASGYFGKPESLGDYCKPCQCSGNIKVDEPGSCDTVTGECLRCLNNTYGTACALCAPGYFGDAIKLKDCQACVCDEIGTQECNSYNGECKCKTNVIGEKCDRCEVEHYGFQTGSGCIPCNCDLASDSNQCDDVTGQCRCKPGVSGRNCDRCTPGFWNYTAEGCISCGCKSEYSLGFGCNAQTGQCECLSGVIGEKCDQCPYRWAFIPDYGCHMCDSCTHDLLDTTDLLAERIDRVISDVDSAESGYFTARRLIHINETFQELKPRILELDPDRINLTPIIQELESLEQDSQNMNRKANYSLENSGTLVVDSKNVGEETDKAFDSVLDTAMQVQKTIANIEQLAFNLSTGEGPKVDSALQEAEFILKELKSFDLTEDSDKVNAELQKVEDLIFELLVYKQPVNRVDEQIKATKDELKDFNDKLDDLFSHTHYAINKAAEADNLYAKNGKDRVEKKLANIANFTADSQDNLKATEAILINATSYLINAQKKFADLAEKSTILEMPNVILNDTLETSLHNLTEIANFLPVVQDHAKNLSRRAEELDNILTETQDTHEKTLKAANAYNEIGTAIEEAHVAAESSKQYVDNATLFYNDIQMEITDSSASSANTLDDAYTSARDIEEFKPKVKQAEVKSRSIRSLHSDNQDKLNNVERFINYYPALSFNELLYQAINVTDKANEHTQNTLNHVGDNYKEVPNEKEASKTLPKKLDDTTRDMLQVQKQLETINEKVPKIIEANEQFAHKEGIPAGMPEALDEKIKKLTQQIALARDIANRIKVGVRFYPNTTLELRNPPNLAELSTSTYISGYFRTNSTDGLLVYLGNGEGTNLRRTKTDDYMVLEIENGYPVLTLDFGSGPSRILHKKYVSTNNWYQFIIERTGLNAKLTIREQEDPDGHVKETISEVAIEGPMTIFNLDRNQSKLFIGSYPSEFKMQQRIQQNSFDGEVEDIVVGDTPISLWNFNSGYENHRGARERNTLFNLRTSNGFRFNGDGYVVLVARSLISKSRSRIQLQFKTFSPQGLLFLYGKDKTFMALELRNGKVLYQYNLGGDTKVWHTTKTYNDGNWHRIHASREGPKGKLFIDDEEIADTTGTIGGHNIQLPDFIYVGGYPRMHEFKGVTNTDFDGCIKDVSIMDTPVDLNSNYKVYGVLPGCPDKFARLVSFGNKGYIKLDRLAVNNDFTMTLKFKTKSSDGLIFYATNTDQTSGISLSLSNGRLVLISQGNQLTSKENFNDSEWHVISIRHNAKELRLDFDDYDFKVTDSAPPPLLILYGHLFIGGLPSHYIVVKKGKVASEEPFIGCIGDATLNGTVINFANSTNKSGDTLGKCLLDKRIGSDGEPHIVPPLAPLGELASSTTTQPVVFEVDENIEDSVSNRGDGGLDSEAVPESTTIEAETVEPLTIVVPTTVEPKTTTSKSTATVSQTPATVVTTLAPPTTSTTTTTTTTEQTPRPHPPTTKPPPAVPSCALNAVAAPTGDSGTVGPFKFDANNSSRLEYMHTRGKHKKVFEFSLDFKTTAPDGLMFYATDKNHKHFIALYLEGGSIVYRFNGGTEIVTLKTPISYNDYEWHNVKFSRETTTVKLIVDANNTFVAQMPENSQKVDITTPLFIGSVKKENELPVSENTNNVGKFQGCIGNFLMNDKVMEPTLKVGIMACPQNIEDGVFFGIEGGYVNLWPKYRVGTVIDIKLDIKPRNVTGLLVAVHGKKDYLVLEMVNGAIRFTVENGRGPITTSYEPVKKHYFCDGEWHTIQAVKSKSVVTLAVDNMFTQPTVGDLRSTSTDTGGALFLGGHRLIKKARGIATRVPYVGCVRNVQINNHAIAMKPNMSTGDVFVGYCPTN